VQVCPTKQVLVPHEHNTVATTVVEHTGLVEHIFPLLVEHICPGLQVVIVPLVPMCMNLLQLMLLNNLLSLYSQLKYKLYYLNINLQIHNCINNYYLMY